MTTPGGVANLPAGALTLDTLRSKTQDMSPAAMRARAAQRIPGTYDASTGGNPTEDLSPFGILFALFGGSMSEIATADPADIQGPEDLPDRFLDFIESIPVVGEFVELLAAITGTYDGEADVLLAIQDAFAPIRTFLQLITGTSDGFPTPEQVEEGAVGDSMVPSTGELRDAVVQGVTGGSTTGNSAADVKAELAAKYADIESRLAALEAP